MPRDEYDAYMREEGRSPVREYRRTRLQANDESEAKGDYIVWVVAVQLAVCLLIVLAVFGLYKSGSQKFTELRDTYTAMFSKDMAPAELKAALKRVSAFVFAPAALDGTDDESEAETENPAVPTTQADASTLADAGGEDLLYPDKTASFAPLTVAGAFTVPVEYTRVSSHFGYRINPVTNRYGFHGGLDLAAPEGTPIFAAFTGTVTKVARSDARGNYIVLSHGSGLETLYCHCSEIVAQEGENIRNGEVIAKVGSTGQATGPHLHWEVHMHDVRFDPAWLLGLHDADA